MMNLSRISSLLCVSVVLVSSVFGQEAANETGPFSPEQAVEKFVLHPDCRIELVASEPDVIDPVAMAFGPDGRLWVVEYSDYPNGPASGEPGRSRVRVLTDPEERKAAVQDVFKVLLEEGVHIPLYTPGWEWVFAVRPEVDGFKVAPFVYPIFNDVKIGES